jgi:hypothetical protein
MVTARNPRDRADRSTVNRVTGPAIDHSDEQTPLGDVASLVDGGEMDCGSGLLLLITRAMRRLEDGQLLGVRSAEASVVTDLPVWAELVGHEVSADVAETPEGPWWFAVRKAGGSEVPSTVFSQGDRTPCRPPALGLHQLRLQPGVPVLLRRVLPEGQLPTSRSRCGP